MDTENKVPLKSYDDISIKGIFDKSLEQSDLSGINTKMNIDKPLLSRAEIERLVTENDDLMFVVDSFSEIMSASTVILNDLIITDRIGNVLFVKECEYQCERYVTAGTNMSLNVIGCNAMGLALKHLRSIEVVADDHHQEFLKDCISVGIPIIRETELIGCVGFIMPLSDAGIKLHVMENVIKTAISAALKMLEARKHLDGLILLKDFVENRDKNQGIILVDGDRKIVHISREAEIVFGVTRDKIIGHLLQEFINEKFNPPRNSISNCHQQELSFKSCFGKMKTFANIIPCLSEQKRVIGWRIVFPPVINKNVNRDKKHHSTYQFKDIIGRNHEFMRLLQLARAIAHSPSSLLITGESGTGKEILAQAIHSAGNRKGNFVAINCTAIPAELLESELFGYEYGAFTGARKAGMIGKFVQADEGTLLLDEIGDMPVELQAKLLRVIQERAVIPIGGNNPVPIDIRIISATNQDLEHLVEEKKFRKDLYYRLNVINLRLPSLKERKDDIPLLVDFFIKKYNRKLNKNIMAISQETLDIFMNYNWPGNIRELENIIERAVNLADDIINPQHLNLEQLNFEKNIIPKMAVDEDEDIISLEEMEKRQIIKTMRAFGGNISYTANALKIGRTTLYRKIKKYGLCPYIKQFID